MNRERFVPWVIASLFAAALMLGVTWDATYESKPADGDNIAAGAGEIRSLRVETRDRSEEEHCFGSGGGSTCTVDSGFHRLGSARAFYGVGTPASLANPAGTALGANDVGRVWFDSDGPDGAGGTYDDVTTFVWSSAAWDVVRAAQPTIVNSATLNNDQVLDFATLDTAPVNLAMTGGAGAGGIPMITTASTGTWDITVHGNFVASWDADRPETEALAYRLQEQIGAGAFVTVAWCVIPYAQNLLGVDISESCSFDYVLRNAVNATTYSYRIRATATANAFTASDVRIDSTQAADQFEGESPDDGFLTVEATRR